MSTAERGPVEITFVSGPEPTLEAPAAVRSAGLQRRLAIVQDSYVEGCVDMVHDRDLWLALADFVGGYGEGLVLVSPDERDLGRFEQTLEAFLADQTSLPVEDQYPPAALLLRLNGALRLCVVTEPWANVGGPDRYHDSWTYAVYADDDLDEVLPAYLRRVSAGRWIVAAGVGRAP